MSLCFKSILLLRLGITLAILIGSVSAQQGNYDLVVNGVKIQGTLLVDGGVNKIAINGVVQLGWTWSVLDTDGDTKADDVRVADPGGGKLDLVNAADAGATDGTTHDGNGAYNPTGNPPHPNQNGTWKR